MAASDGHTVDLVNSNAAFDTCLHCRLAIQEDIYTERLVTMIGRNQECYGR